MTRMTFLAAALLVAACAAPPGAPASDLLETYWRVVAIEGQGVARRPGTREPHIVLKREGGRVSGFAGCNNLTGTFQQDGNALRFGDRLAMTRMACVGEGGALEAAFTKALLSTASWQIVGDVLELRDAQGAARMILETRKDSYR